MLGHSFPTRRSSDLGKVCSATGNGKGGVTIDLGQLLGTGGLLDLVHGDIKITVDAITAHAYQKGTDPAVLGATVANVYVQLGRLAKLPVHIGSAPNQDLLTAVLNTLSPQLGLLGTALSNLVRPLVSLTTNYQPEATMAAHQIKAAAAGGTDPSVSGLHISLLTGSLGSADLAKVTVGPNAPSAGTDAFSFAKAPIILGGLGLLVALAYGVRFGVRRVRAFV